MPCITLISDFGLHDASVAVARGVLMQHVPGMPVVDISHEVTPYLTAQAAYLLGTAWGSFPQGTVHLVLFDIFYGPTPRLLLSAHGGHWFLAPDNGVIPAALDAVPDRSWLCFELGSRHTFTDWLHEAAKEIKNINDQNPNHRSQIADHKSQIANPQITDHKSQIPNSPDELPCDVIHTDHYGNVVTGVTRQQFEAARQGRRFRLQFMQHEEITALSNHYSDVREGFRLCRFNSAGHLEICINHGNAAGLLGLRPGSRHNDLKIYFE